MLKRFYRLKRQKGVVLFMVIAIMTLLIAMATTAYMTARSSYKTVVSNYDFSQLYLSATSVSDMMVELVTLDTTVPGALVDDPNDISKKASEGEPKEKIGTTNDFDSIKRALIQLEKNSGVGGTLTLYTSNIVALAGENSEAKALQAADNPLEELNGILDGVEVTFKFLKTGSDYDALGKNTGLTRNYISITTTAYYRDSFVSVQDIVYNKSGTPEPDMFDSYFTATGNSDGGMDTSRLVIVDSHEITDDTFFDSKYTFFRGDIASNKMMGGLRTSGNLYLKKINFDNIRPNTTKTEYNKKFDADGNREADTATTVWGDRSDWYIGGDLLLNDASANIKLQNNNIYVNGDLILAGGQISSCNNIYVNGNIYIANEGSSRPVNAQNILVRGNIYNNINDAAQLATFRAAEGDPTATFDPGGYNEMDATIRSVLPGINVTNSSNMANFGSTKVFVVGKNYATGSGGSVKDNATYDDYKTTTLPSQLYTTSATRAVTESGYPYVQNENNKNTDKLSDVYVERGSVVDTDITALDGIFSSATNRRSFDNYTAKQETLNQVLDLDFDELKGRNFPKNEQWEGTSNIIDNGDNTYFIGVNEWGGKVTDFSTASKIYLITDVINYMAYDGSGPQPGSIKGGTYYEVSLDDYNNKSTAQIIADANKKYEYNADTSATYKLYSKDALGNWDTGVNKNATGGTSYETNVKKVKKDADGKIMKDALGNVLYEDTTAKATIEKSGDNYTIKLPFIENGYTLGVYNVPIVNGSIKYYIATKESPKVTDATGKQSYSPNNTLPIVLKANFKEGSDPEDENGYNAFSWSGNVGGRSGYSTDVILVDANTDGSPNTSVSAKGDAVFEIGNYKKIIDNEVTGEGHMEYVPYVKSDPTITVPTYYEGTRIVTGTKNQVDKIEGNTALMQGDANTWLSNGFLTPKVLADGTSIPSSYPAAGYEDHLVFVSNKSGGNAVVGKMLDHTMCAYLYAPNGTYDASGGGGSGGGMRIFGGMIVGFYNAELEHWIYASPDPSKISNMLKGLKTPAVVVGDDGWYSVDHKNYLG